MDEIQRVNALFTANGEVTLRKGYSPNLFCGLCGMTGSHALIQTHLRMD
jgi:hypothetical protein